MMCRGCCRDDHRLPAQYTMTYSPKPSEFHTPRKGNDQSRYSKDVIRPTQCVTHCPWGHPHNRRPDWGALFQCINLAAAATAVVAAVVVVVVAAAAATVAEDQQQNNDPPPVVAAEAVADTIIVTHRNTSKNFVELCCPHSML